MADSVQRIENLYGVQVGAVMIGGIIRQSAETGTEVRGEPASGMVYATTQSIVKQEPVASFASWDIAAVLNATGLTGSDIANLSGGLKLFGQRRAKGGTRSGSAVHRKITYVDGILALQSLRCSHDGDAEIDCQAYATYDGNNDPMQLTNDMVLPALGTEGARYALGPGTLGAVDLMQKQDLDISFGIGVEVEGGDGLVWPTFASIGTIVPVITFKGSDPDWFKAANIPLLGKAGTHANTIFYLRKRLNASTFVADNVGEHIKFTIDGLGVIDTPMSLDGGGAGETSLSVTTRYDGSNAPMLIDTASTIT